MISIMAQPPTLTPRKDFSKSVAFATETPWPSALPGVAYNQVIIGGDPQPWVFHYQDPKWNMDDFLVLFKSLYSQLSFAELAWLRQSSEMESWFPFEKLVESYGFAANERFLQSVTLFLNLPIGFQNWSFQKKLAPQDLSPLVAADLSSSLVKALMIQILERALSKSQGVQALDWGVDLILMGRTAEELQLTPDSQQSLLPTEDWLRLLKSMRYPQTFSQDELKQQELSQIRWPQNTQVRWVRQGDKAGVELKLFFGTGQDLKKYTQSLGQLEKFFEQDAPWSESKKH